MNKIEKLRLCNLWLMVTGLLVLMSGLQMEVCGGCGCFGLPFSLLMYVHCALGIFMFVLVAIHLYLHFGKCNWFSKIKGMKNIRTKWLAVCFSITVILSLVAFFYILETMKHTPIGGIHGKIGFFFLAYCLGHTIKRWKWVKKQIFKTDN